MADKEKAASEQKDSREKTAAVEDEKVQSSGAEELEDMEEVDEEIASVLENEMIASLQDELEQAKSKADENWNEYLRSCAELENTKRRMERDVEKAHKFAVEKFVLELLPVKDSLEMGLAAAKDQTDNTVSVQKLIEGKELTLKMLTDAMNKFGVEMVDPLDQPFDPEYHQAMSMQESETKAANTVLAVMQKGYTLHGRLIRPAMVVVSKAASKTEDNEQKQGDERVGANIDEQA